MEGLVSELQLQIMAAAAQHRQVLITTNYRRMGKTAALENIARKEALAGGNVVILSVSRRSASNIAKRLDSVPGITCLPQQDNALTIDQYPATCVLIDDAGHMEPTVFFREIVPLLSKREGIRLVCVGEDSGLLHSLLNQNEFPFEKVNLNNVW